MNPLQAKYKLLNDQENNRNPCLRIFALFCICTASSAAVFITWNAVYRQTLKIPPKMTDIPIVLTYKNEIYEKWKIENKINNLTITNTSNFVQTNNFKIKQIDNERIYPSKLGNFIYKTTKEISTPKLVCYYYIPNLSIEFQKLYPKDINPNLCTHINIGIVNINNSQLIISDNLNKSLFEIKQLKIKNRDLKVLLWIGGAESSGFPEMIKNHQNRKIFIRSIKSILEIYRLDGIDLDWEFPSAFKRERQHFSQLLHEIRREYQRDHRTWILSIAVAASEEIIYFSYDIDEINNYVDYVNIMTYDYHFYSKFTPFTGLNAPLFARRTEKSIFFTLNINYTVKYWETHGLEKSKIIIGLPTYGHSFRLINNINNKIYSPAGNFGQVGYCGFVSYPEVCWFEKNNYFVKKIYDIESCSPYLYAGYEWISYDNEISLECKTKFIRDNGYGGAMIFSLNSDDYISQCDSDHLKKDFIDINKTFPLTRKINSVLFQK